MKLVLIMIELILIVWAVTYTSQIKLRMKQILFFALTVFCPTSFIFLWVGQWQGIIYFIVSSLIYFFLLTKKFIILIQLCFFIIIGILVDNLAQYIMQSLSINFLPGVLDQYCFFIVLFIISVFIYRYFHKKFITLLPEIKSVIKFIFFVVIVTMVTFYINIYLTDYLSKDTVLIFNIVIQITYFVIMLFILSLTILNIKKQHDIQKIEFENNQFNSYMESLELINNDMQKFRHDYNNILFTMQGYIEINDFEGLKEYFKQHIFSTEMNTLKRNQLLANLSKMKVTGIKGLLLTKILQAEKENISINIEIPEDIEDIHMNVIDLARILGIFLDNAIEANYQSNQKINFDSEIDIAFIKTNDDSLMIIIENTFYDEEVDLENIFEDGFSTKGKNRGKGLSNVKSILKNYPNVKLNTTVNDYNFTQILEIKNIHSKKLIKVER